MDISELKEEDKISRVLTGLSITLWKQHTIWWSDIAQESWNSQLKGNYSVTGFQLILKRKMSHYIITYYFPAGMFVIVSWIRSSQNIMLDLSCQNVPFVLYGIAWRLFFGSTQNVEKPYLSSASWFRLRACREGWRSWWPSSSSSSTSSTASPATSQRSLSVIFALINLLCSQGWWTHCNWDVHDRQHHLRLLCADRYQDSMDTMSVYNCKNSLRIRRHSLLAKDQN